MRIGIEATPYYRNVAGSGIFVRNIVRSLQRAKREEVSFILFSSKRENDIAMEQKKNLPARFLKGMLDILRMQVLLPLESKKQGIHVLFCPAYLSPLFPTCPVVVAMHDMSFRRYPWTLDRLYLFYLQILLPLSARKAKLLVTISEFSKREMTQCLKIPPEKIRVVPLACGEHFLVVEEEGQISAFRKKHNLLRPFILFVGTLEPRKNILRLLEAFRILKEEDRAFDYQLVLCGPKGWSYRDIFRKVRKFRLEKEIIYLGYLPDEELPLLYNAARGLIYPSLYEGFGLPVFEAMACGCPVVTSNTSALPETAGDAALLVDPEDTRAIARAIIRITGDEKLRYEMIQKGLERVRAFSWEKTALGIFEVLREAGGNLR